MGNVADHLGKVAAELVNATDDLEPLRCAACGRELTGDPDEDPTGDAGQPICGECARERDFFDVELLADTIDEQA